MNDGDLTKRKIDRIRDSAGSFKVGDDSDGSISSMTTIGGRLYLIKEKSIYVFSFADEIDPDRKREDIPNTIQKVFDVGSNDEVVIRTILTGIELFKKDRLVDSVDFEAALSSAMEILRDLAAAIAVIEEVEAFLAKTRGEQVVSKDRAVSLPSFPALQAQTKNFIQKLDHAMQNIFNLICVFYDEKTLRSAGKWLDGLANHLSNTLKPDENFVLFARELAVFGKMVRNTRHCIEHPKPTQRIELSDYKITANLECEEPSISVIHDETPIDPTPIDQFLRHYYENALAGAELLMAHLAMYHVATFGKFPIGVGEIPEGQRINGVRFGYLMNMGGKLQRLG
ncbi:MAG: hypothetical protein KKB37_17295 [Alphaproteobacteria bacterium]|nr:hypothetical protein [Alphaproteobacteria bacterium]